MQSNISAAKKKLRDGKIPTVADEWFKRKFGDRIQPIERVNESQPKFKKYDDLKEELAKRLAVRRTEDLERRYSYYNAENEIFDESGLEEDEEQAEIEATSSHQEKDEAGNSNEKNQQDETKDNSDKKEEEIEDENDEEEDIDEEEADDEEEEASGNEAVENHQSDEEKATSDNQHDEDETTIFPRKRPQIQSDDEDDIEHEDEEEEDTEHEEEEEDDEADGIDEDEEINANDISNRDITGCDPDTQEIGFGNAQDMRNKLFNDEASLSGDDVGDDEPEEDNIEGLDEYEAEEGDLDELPDEEEIRDNLVRQFLKHQKDSDDRKLLKLQEALFADSDLHGQSGTGDRSFRLRMHDDSKIDWTKILGVSAEEGQDEEEDEVEGQGTSNWRERRVEMLKWKLEQEREGSRKRRRKDTDDDAEEHNCIGENDDADQVEEELDLDVELGAAQGELFKLGEQLLQFAGMEKGNKPQNSTGKSAANPSSCPISSNPVPQAVPKRDSLLLKANCLESLVKDGKQGGTVNAMASLFTSQTQNN